MTASGAEALPPTVESSWARALDRIGAGETPTSAKDSPLDRRTEFLEDLAN
ncbi:hypothetical protein ACEZCY_30260 [Streptacidiphilus sp. N1-12]|uniref:Uncharacterized protein n=2 Tax=Streptacidiphilus alkalitolerans TaxID=3342712 RepID=A0ABV6WN55_9ACTN